MSTRNELTYRFSFYARAVVTISVLLLLRWRHRTAMSFMRFLKLMRRLLIPHL